MCGESAATLLRTFVVVAAVCLLKPPQCLFRELATDRNFLHELPQLAAAIFFLPCGADGVVFGAANECLQTILASSTHRRLVNIAEEACGVTHEMRLRERAMDCILQLLLQWPAPKLRRQEAQLRRMLQKSLAAPDASQRMRRSTRRAIMVFFKKLPECEAELRAELGANHAQSMKIEQEEMWALAQLRSCSFGVGSPESVPGARPADADSKEGSEQSPRQDVRTEEEDGLQMIPTAAQAAAKHRWKKVKIFARVTAMGYSAAVRDAQRTTPLHFLCASRTLALGPLKSLLAVLTTESRLAEDAYHRVPLHVLCDNSQVSGEMLAAMMSGVPASAAVHEDEDGRTPLHVLCANRAAWTARQGRGSLAWRHMLGVASVVARWGGWELKDSSGRTPLDLLARHNKLNAAVIEALVNGSAGEIAKLGILTQPQQPKAPVMMDEDETVSVSPLHWLCMQHMAASADASTVPLRVIQTVVEAFPEAATAAGPGGQTPLHLLCSASHSREAHFLTISIANSGCWEICNLDHERPLDILASNGTLTPTMLLTLVKQTPRLAEVPMRDTRYGWSSEPLTVLHWLCIRLDDFGRCDSSESRALIATHEDVGDEAAWRAELEPMALDALRKLALAEGITEAQLEQAEDDPFGAKSGIVSRVVERYRAAALGELEKELESLSDGGGSQASAHQTLHRRATVASLRRVLEAFPDALLRQDEEGRNPLHILCTHRHVFAEVITLFTNADPVSRALRQRDKQDNSALDLLLCSGALSVQLLHDIVEPNSSVATVDMKDTHGPGCDDFGPGAEAERQGVELMGVKPTRCNDATAERVTPLHWLCAQPDVNFDALSVVMVAAGSAGARCDRRGQTPLHYLCRNPAASAQMLQEFQRLNEDPVSAVDSKHVLLSQASAEVVLASLDQVAEPNPGDEARLILKQMLKDQDAEVASLREKRTLEEWRRRKAAKESAGAGRRRAVHRAQQLVDKRGKKSAARMAKERSGEKPRRGLRGASLGKELPKLPRSETGKQHRSVPEPRTRGVHFLTSEQRVRPKSPPRHLSTAHHMAAMPAGSGRTGRDRQPLRVQSEPQEPHMLVDWAAADHVGDTALHVLCRAPTPARREMLLWAAGCLAATGAWEVRNRGGNTPLDVLRNEDRDSIQQGYRLSASLLADLVERSEGRMAMLRLRPTKPNDSTGEEDVGETLLSCACSSEQVGDLTADRLKLIVNEWPEALIEVSGKLRRNPLQVLCANPRARTGHLRTLLRSPCGREAAAAQDAEGSTALHLLCRNHAAIAEPAVEVVIDEYTSAVVVQDKWGRLAAHYAASLPGVSKDLLHMVAEPRSSGRRRPRRATGRAHVHVTRDVHGHTPLEVLARNGGVEARVVRSVAGVGALGLSDGGRSDTLIAVGGSKVNATACAPVPLLGAGIGAA